LLRPPVGDPELGAVAAVVARKKRREPSGVNSLDIGVGGAGMMSRTRNGAGARAVVFHSSVPAATVNAVKECRSGEFTMSSGSESAGPGAMSRTRNGNRSERRRAVGNVDPRRNARARRDIGAAAGELPELLAVGRRRRR